METEQAFQEKRCELEGARAEAAQSVDHQRLLGVRSREHIHSQLLFISVFFFLKKKNY